MYTVTKVALASAVLSQTAFAGLYPGLSPNNHSCALQTPLLSCSSGAVAGKVDSCCVETYGGLVLATQFWSTYTGLEKQGQLLPQNEWTLHGLWPDFCNGSYTQYCDLKRQYDPEPSPNTTNGLANGTAVPPYKGETIENFLTAFGKYDLIAYMKKYWIAQNQPNWYFWGHEFSKHATCFSTFDVECYGPKYQQNEEVVEFFETAISYYRILPTYGWLSAAGIRPSNSTKVSLTSLQAALTKGFGAVPYIGCAGPRYNATDAGKGSTDNGYTVVSEVWYYYNVFGRPQARQGIPIAANATGGSLSSCAKAANALTYPTRSNGSEIAY